jgi:hypothetical protein
MVCSQIIHVKGGLMRNRVLQILYVAMIAVVAPIAASAADLAGARDPDFMQRFSGSEIVDYLTSPYVSYTLGLDPSFDKTRAIEGQLTRVVYRVPGGHTVIEVIRNYEQSLASRGFTSSMKRRLAGVCTRTTMSGACITRAGKAACSGRIRYSTI